jgi:hypothetical protein
MNTQENINAPTANVILSECAINEPFAGGVLYYKEMKLIKDVGRLYPYKDSKKKVHFAIYECPICGRSFLANVGNVNKGSIVSCKCERRKRLVERNFVHGQSGSKLYYVWCAMKSRCYHKANKSFNNYGGRGITVCEEWRNNYKAFYKWSQDNGYAIGLILDRINNDGNYEPDNCRWTTRSVNNQNVRKKRNNTSGFRGVHKHGKKWGAAIGIDLTRIRLGSFDDPVDAAKAYDEAAKKHFGERAALNFPDNNK